MHQESPGDAELPDDLYICAACGEACGRGRFGGDSRWAESRCLCEGLVCKECGIRCIRRPVTNYYDWRTGKWWHVPHLAHYFGRCRSCRGLKD